MEHGVSDCTLNLKFFSRINDSTSLFPSPFLHTVGPGAYIAILNPTIDNKWLGRDNNDQVLLMTLSCAPVVIKQSFRGPERLIDDTSLRNQGWDVFAPIVTSTSVCVKKSSCNGSLCDKQGLAENGNLKQKCCCIQASTARATLVTILNLKLNIPNVSHSYALVTSSPLPRKYTHHDVDSFLL